MHTKKFNISVLIVDDDLATLALIEEAIRDRVDQYYLAQNGAEALERFHSSSIDLIISDVYMPVMDGLELLKQVRIEDKDLPFIFFTGSKSSDILTEAVKCNVTSFLYKPVILKDLLAKMEEVANAKTLKLDFIAQQTIFEQYKNAVDISSIVSKTDRNGIITYVNDRFCDISGYTREELIGQPHSIVRSEDMPSSMFKELWETIQSKNIWRGVLHNRAKDGSRYIVKTTVSPIVDINGEIYEFIAIREDVTELENAKNKAEESARIKSDFIANMSHEIRTPMNAIIGFISLLKNTVLSEQQGRYLDIVSKATNHLLSVVNEILDFSKIEKNKMLLKLGGANLIKEMASIAELYQLDADEKKIEFRVNVDTAIHNCLNVDLVHLKQILGNLIGNAIKFTETGYVSIDVSLIQTTEGVQRLRFSVKDSGIGILPENQKDIFDPFSQADNSKTRKYGGTGLGLAISSKLVELMGSTLCVESVFGEGSEFYFETDFEICEDNNPLDDEKTLSTEDLPKQLRSIRILIAEDDETNRYLIEEMLKELNVNADYARNGEESVRMVMNNYYDLVFMDITMPIMSGVEAAEILRRDGINLPIIAMTANSMEGDKEMYLNVGMNDCISKPFVKDDFFKIIEKYGRK